jgi:hypothetical protein
MDFRPVPFVAMDSRLPWRKTNDWRDRPGTSVSTPLVSQAHEHPGVFRNGTSLYQKEREPDEWPATPGYAIIHNSLKRLRPTGNEIG